MLLNMKKIFSIQLSDFHPSATLPQAIGSLLGYVLENTLIRANFISANTFWQNETQDEVINQIDQPDILLCSCYVWNWDRTYQVIKHVRTNYPHCLIVVGGPEPEYTTDWLLEHPEIDILVPYYGEQALENILIENLDNANYSTVPGIITKNGASSNYTAPDYSRMISPYLNGFFDSLLKRKNKETVYVRAVFESNRGCPFSCTFCDVGSAQYNRINKFELERSFRELEWIVKNNISVVDVADANFGILPRDEEIVDKLVELKDKYSWKGRFLPTWSKVKGDRVLRIAKTIINNDLDSIFGLSLQSLSPVVLKNINRKNAFDLNSLSEIINDLSESNVPVYTEIIFPLPGETLNSFKDGIHDVLDMENVFDKFQVNQLSRYNNAEIASIDQTKDYGISWVQISGFTRHYHGDNSKDTIAISTKDITKDEVFECLFYVKCFIIPLYFYGLIRYFVDGLRLKFGVKRSNFFIDLYKCLSEEEWFDKFKQSQKDHYFSAIAGKTQFGQILTSDEMNFFPEYSVAHQFFLRSPLFEKLFEKYPDYTDLIRFSMNALWVNKAEETFLTIKDTNQTETWYFADDREETTDVYFKELYISGRFDRRWEKRKIQRVDVC
jgi:putative methyltransferase